MQRVVSLRQLRRAVEQGLKRIGYERPVRRGRKPRYSEALIVTLALYMQQERLSIREVLQRARDELGEPMPVPSTLVHRLHRMDPEVMERLVEALGEWVVACSSPPSSGGDRVGPPGAERSVQRPPPLLHAMDGTGFGYDDVLGLSYQRGKQVRRVRAHVRAVVLMRLWEGQKLGPVVGSRAGRAYASELKLAETLLQRVQRRATPLGIVLADALYDATGVLELTEKAGGEPLVGLKAGRCGRTVRHPLRQAVQQRHEHYGHLYRRRSAIEALFSQTKRKLGSTLRARNERVAMVLMLARFACWNVYLLACAAKDGGETALFFFVLFVA